jgi:hypothetical protein
MPRQGMNILYNFKNFGKSQKNLKSYLNPANIFEHLSPNRFSQNQFVFSKIEPKSSNIDFSASPHVFRSNIRADGTRTLKTRINVL